MHVESILWKMGVLENSKLQKRVLIKKREKHMRYYLNLEFLVTNKNRGLYQQNKDFVAGVLFCYALLSFQRTAPFLCFTKTTSLVLSYFSKSSLCFGEDKISYRTNILYAFKDNQHYQKYILPQRSLFLLATITTSYQALKKLLIVH